MSSSQVVEEDLCTLLPWSIVDLSSLVLVASEDLCTLWAFWVDLGLSLDLVLAAGCKAAPLSLGWSLGVSLNCCWTSVVDFNLGVVNSVA